VRRVILCWRQYEIGTKIAFLAIELGAERRRNHGIPGFEIDPKVVTGTTAMVVSGAVHRARLLKTDIAPGWRRMHKSARFARKRCLVFLARSQNDKLNQQLAGCRGKRLNVS
jgi:hypothetical protein